MNDVFKYRFFSIQHRGSEMFEGRPVYRIYNNKNEDQIGVVSWYKPWRKYVFSSKEGCIFDVSCLLDVLDFMNKL